VPSDREQTIVDTVIARLIDVRRKKGISQNRLSELTGLSRSGIRHLENGETNPTLYTLLKIATALDVKIGRLIGAVCRASEP
jgi:transcriptional regulator with XRE-family HTH domain